MANIIFFPRNEAHQNIYLKIAENINKKHNIFLLHENLNHFINNNIKFVNYEKDVLIHLKKIQGSSWKKYLENEFLNKNKKNFLFYEREFNYFPGYFGYSKYNYDYQCKYLYSLHKVLYKIIKKYKPKFVISELINGMPDAILNDFSKKTDFKYICMRTSKISDGVVFCNPNNDIPINLGINEFKINVSNINQIISNIEKKIYEAPQYMELTKNSFNFLKLSRFQTLFHRIKKEVIILIKVAFIDIQL